MTDTADGPAVVIAGSGHGCRVHLPALQHGCHVLCEKPFARDAGEARELLLAAERAGVVHRRGHQMRALPVVAERPGAAEDSFNVRFELASGLQGVILQTAAAWGPMVSVTRVVGSEGTLWLEKGEAWLAAIEGRATEESFATFADGLATMEVIDAIRRSAAEGGELVRVGQDAG